MARALHKTALLLSILILLGISPSPAYAKSGHEDLRYEATYIELPVDTPRLNLMLHIVFEGTVGVDWDLDKTELKPGESLTLRVKGTGTMNLKLKVVQGKIILSIVEVEKDIKPREMPLKRMQVPAEEESSVTIPIEEGVLVAPTLKIKTEIMHEAGVATTLLDGRRQRELGEAIEYKFTVMRPAGAEVRYGQKIIVTVTPTVEITGLIKAIVNPAIRSEVLEPIEKQVVLTTLSEFSEGIKDILFYGMIAVAIGIAVAGSAIAIAIIKKRQKRYAQG